MRILSVSQTLESQKTLGIRTENSNFEFTPSVAEHPKKGPIAQNGFWKHFEGKLLSKMDTNIDP